MEHRRFFTLAIMGLILAYSISGCAGPNHGKLPRAVNPSAKELRENWNDYIVYFRGTAFVYKIKNDKKIILDRRWIEVTTDEMMAKSKIWDSTWTRKILTQNDELYGYLVHRSADVATVKIIDDNTMQLFYHYVRNYR